MAHEIEIIYILHNLYLCIVFHISCAELSGACDTSCQSPALPGWFLSRRSFLQRVMAWRANSSLTTSRDSWLPERYNSWVVIMGLPWVFWHPSIQAGSPVDAKEFFCMRFWERQYPPWSRAELCLGWLWTCIPSETNRVFSFPNWCFMMFQLFQGCVSDLFDFLGPCLFFSEVAASSWSSSFRNRLIQRALPPFRWLPSASIGCPLHQCSWAWPSV